MQWVMTFVAVVAGLILSLAVAVVTEELIFGRLLALFFFRPATHTTAVHTAAAAKDRSQR